MGLALGAALGVGGIVAYMRKGSKASLFAGCGLGFSLFGSGLVVVRDPKRGFFYGTFVSTVLTLGMVPRFLKTKKFMPSGLVSLLGVVSLVYNGKKWYEWSD